MPVGNYQAAMKNTSTAGPSVTMDWTVVLEENQRWLRTVVAARSGELQAVAEIMQEISMAVIKQQAPLQDKNKLAPWLYQIAVRQSLMYRRKHGRRRNLEQRYADRIRRMPTRSDPANPLEWLIANERRELIRRGIEQLNPKDAEILLLKYTQDWTYQQIAESQGISESAVESRLHRARQRLRRHMVALEVVETR